MLENFVPPYDAHVIERLQGRRRGPVRQDEHGRVRDGLVHREQRLSGRRATRGTPARIPGGSSRRLGGGGRRRARPRCRSGTDTGGSIRQPAALCGIVGLKPTYGRVSRYGLIAFASSLDQIGPFAHDVADAALLLEVIAGHDPRDSTSVDQPGARRTRRRSNDPVKPLRDRRGRRSSSARGSTPRSRRRCATALKVYEKLGATVEDVSLPHTKYAHRGLLHRRPGRGVEQPRPLRRHALRPPHRRQKADLIAHLLRSRAARGSARR